MQRVEKTPHNTMLPRKPFSLHFYTCFLLKVAVKKTTVPAFHWTEDFSLPATVTLAVRLMIAPVPSKDASHW